MKKISELSIGPDTPIIDVMKVLETSYAKTVFVVDDEGQLLGSVTDGDIRRGIIKKFNPGDAIRNIMNAKPILVRSKDGQIDVEAVRNLIMENKINAVPVVDELGKIIKLVTSEGLMHDKVKLNTVVIMAGGLGSRLGELTADCPKPMLKVGDKPILQIIIENLKEHGFRNFYISVNYKADVIENYFQDGKKFSVSIKYIKEKEKMGTAGSLTLLPERNGLPIIVMNGDVLTKVDFNQLLLNHEKSRYVASMCVRKFDFQVPFGVIETQGEFIRKIEEKPLHSFFVNAGIYVINHEALDEIPKGCYFDMPALFDRIIALNKNGAGVFPIHEYWLDVGRKDDFERAQFDVLKVF